MPYVLAKNSSPVVYDPKNNNFDRLYWCSGDWTNALCMRFSYHAKDSRHVVLERFDHKFSEDR